MVATSFAVGTGPGTLVVVFLLSIELSTLGEFFFFFPPLFCLSS